ncbi:hypothetical protein [Psychroflexus maritimus]|uniref:Addiction module component n=1 Tax=Psychroflexus maritimus TaxID=2714865 RepID=A0A967ABQ5_9FLAO|nr:hypothetical protein [Psychroflexus maritimus]NGZ89327.1 hypothetical protein [Psychroflexus maritimus]
MDIQTRKIKFIQEFLKLQNDELISKFEKILKKEKKSSNELIENPMTKEVLNDRIEKSESDFKNKRFKKTSELLTKYQ